MTMYKIFSRLALTVAVALGLGAMATADTTFVDEDFESYADDTALYGVWGPSNAAGILVDETYTEFITLDDVDPQDIGARAFPSGGQGVAHTGGSVLVYQPTLNGGTAIEPTETESIVLQGDIFDTGALGNKRMSIGLRSTTPDNIVELGHWNTEASELAGRAILFGDPAVAEQPNWQFYELPVELDRPDDADEVTTLADLGEDWHTHRVTITPTTITYEIDLFRDGLDAATGSAGFDSSMTFDVVPTASGFNELRLGGPSGVTSGGNGFYGGVIFDNISLKLVDVVGIEGDFDGDGDVDIVDFGNFATNFGMTGLPIDPPADGDFDLDGDVDIVDFGTFGQNFGIGVPGSGAAIPEPASLVLIATLLACLPVRRR